MTAKPQTEPTLAEMIAKMFSTLDTEAPIDSGSASDELTAFHARLTALANKWMKIQSKPDCHRLFASELLAKIGVLNP